MVSNYTCLRKYMHVAKMVYPPITKYMLDIVTQSLLIVTHNCRYGKQLYKLTQMVHVATVLSYMVMSKYVQYLYRYS